MSESRKIFAERTQAERARTTAVAPRFVEASRNYLFPEIWENAALSKRDRSLITISILLTKGFPETLRAHIGFGLANGLTREEIGETITHAAFYAGFPNAHIAAEAAFEVYQEADGKA
jgi:4-carboxymuconolactone decarboxylase